ncbi:MAG: hypothetical protein AB1635_16495 [Acidobacteriota bacterium]
MGRISLSQARAGQEVIRPVANANGVVLVQAGTRLTDALIDRLRALGVGFVMVAGSSQAEAPKPPARLAAELEARFAGHEGDPLMMEIKRIVGAQLPQVEG